jgi:hypothetical protein
MSRSFVPRDGFALRLLFRLCHCLPFKLELMHAMRKGKFVDFDFRGV